MMRSSPLRSTLIAAALLLTAVVWLLFAPTRLGGSTDYVSTHGDSMAPRFHTGDLALIRRAEDYRVGDVVAYRSRLLHAVVLHRIVARDGDRYVFKGDNNDFLDPVNPRRSALIGKLWLHIPHGGTVLAWLHAPIVAGALSGGAALLLLFGGRRRRRRRDRSRRGGGDSPVARTSTRRVTMLDARHATTACAAAAGAFLLLALLAFMRPETKPVTVNIPYTEKVAFGYHAEAAGAGPVYPGGTVSTGDPVFLRLVRRVRFSVAYRLTTAVPHRLRGSISLVARLTSPTGWSRSIELRPATRFAGDRASGQATLDLVRLRSLIERVEHLTGAPSGGEYTLAVVPRLQTTGTLAGESLTSHFAPALSFQLSALQLRPGSAAATPNGKENGLTPSRAGTVAATRMRPVRLAVLGKGVNVTGARRIALIGLLVAGAGGLLAALRQRRRRSDLAADIQARYGRLIVPIAGAVHSPARAPIDVTSIDALVQLAERGERLILHHRHEHTSTYVVDDEGTLYRYQVRCAGDCDSAGHREAAASSGAA